MERWKIKSSITPPLHHSNTPPLKKSERARAWGYKATLEKHQVRKHQAPRRSYLPLKKKTNYLETWNLTPWSLTKERQVYVSLYARST
jgi:hypothetical protein